MYKFIKVLTMALLIMTVALPAALAAEKNPNITEVQVGGSHQAEMAPDIAYINLGTLTEAATVTAAQTKNAEISANLRRQLADLGIKPEYIKTAHYTVTPLYKNDDNGRRLPSIIGYQITNSITVTAAPEQAGEIIDTALTAGANQVNNIRFGKKDESEIKNAALAQAVRDAMSKAEAVAATLNKRIVRVKSVTETGINLQSPELAGRVYSKSLMADATPVSAGLVMLSANAQIVVELE